jgi:hypothetical protein
MKNFDKKIAGKQQKEEEAAAAAWHDIMMVDRHQSSHEVLDPTIHPSLEILKSLEATTSSNALRHILHNATNTAENDYDEGQEIMDDTVNNLPDKDHQWTAAMLISSTWLLLSQISISSLSEGNMRVSDPLSLLDVAIHAMFQVRIKNISISVDYYPT